MSSEDDIQHKLAVLKEKYLANLPDKIEQLINHWNDLQNNQEDTEQQQTTIRAFHTLAGSGTSFGFPDITNLTREIENTIKNQLQENTCLDGTTKDYVELKLKELHELDLNPQNTHETDTDTDTDTDSNHQNSLPVNNHLVCLLNFEKKLAEEIKAQIHHYGYRCKMPSNHIELEELCLNSSPGTFILHLDQNSDHDPLLKIIQLKNAETPLIVISEKKDTTYRLDAVRSGAKAFFHKPLDYPFFIDTLDKLTNKQAHTSYRVLIMDDSQSTADFYSYTLQSAGMVTQVVTDPFNIMEELDSFSPEIILMDLYMPHCNGTELAAVIRQEENYVGTPIVFLSSETNVDKQNLAMSQGGDDFLTKPIKAEHLISAVRTRAERYRKLRSFMVRDSLTGLYNHTSTKELLQREFARVARSNGELSYAMVDIDFFKQVNDNYGHPVGDEVIKILARLLKQRLRRTDIVGRYGGEEFAVIMPDTKPVVAARVIDEIRQSFTQIELAGKASDLRLSFSAGIAGFPMISESKKLNEAADNALYQAKNSGRNRVILYDKR